MAEGIRKNGFDFTNNFLDSTLLNLIIYNFYPENPSKISA